MAKKKELAVSNVRVFPSSRIRINAQAAKVDKSFGEYVDMLSRKYQLTKKDFN